MTKKEQAEREQLQKHQYKALNHTVDEFIFRYVLNGIVSVHYIMSRHFDSHYWRISKKMEIDVRADFAMSLMDRLTDEEVASLKKAYARLKEGDVDWYEDYPEIKHLYKDEYFMAAFYVDRGVIIPNQGLEVEPSSHVYEFASEEDDENFDYVALTEAFTKEEMEQEEASFKGECWWKDLPVVYKPKAKKTKKAVVETPSKELVETPTEEPVVEAPKEPQEAPKETAQPSKGIVIPSVAKCPSDKPSYAELERRCEEQEAEIERLRGLLAQVKANAQAIMDLV